MILLIIVIITLMIYYNMLSPNSSTVTLKYHIIYSLYNYEFIFAKLTFTANPTFLQKFYIMKIWSHSVFHVNYVMKYFSKIDI